MHHDTIGTIGTAGHSRYGDTGEIRALARSMRAQARDIEHEGDLLDRRTTDSPWTGLAADAMRRTAATGTQTLRRTAALHDDAARALDRHADEVDRIVALIHRIEHGVLAEVAAARHRIAGLGGLVGAVDPVDELLAHFDPPPSGHRAWLGVPAELGYLGSVVAGALR